MIKHPLHDLAMQIRYDLTAAQSKLTELIRQIGEHDLPDKPQLECGHCRIRFRSPTRLAEHIYTSHGGPVPAHYQAIEAASIEPDEHNDPADPDGGADWVTEVNA